MSLKKFWLQWSNPSLLPQTAIEPAASDNTRVATNDHVESLDAIVNRYYAELQAKKRQQEEASYQMAGTIGPKRFDTKAAPIKSQEQLDKERRHQEASTTAKDFEENVLGPGLIEAATWFPMIGPVAKGVSIGMKAVGNAAKGLVRRGLIGREAKKLATEPLTAPLLTLGNKPWTGIAYDGTKSYTTPTNSLTWENGKRLLEEALAKAAARAEKVKNFVPRHRGDYYNGLDADWENPLQVYHGGASKFDRFAHNLFRGTGEGGAAYGEGNYVSNSPDVSRKYAHIAASNAYPTRRAPWEVSLTALDGFIAQIGDEIKTATPYLYQLYLADAGKRFSSNTLEAGKYIAQQNERLNLMLGSLGLSRGSTLHLLPPAMNNFSFATKEHLFNVFTHPERFKLNDKYDALTNFFGPHVKIPDAYGHRHLMGFDIPNPERNFYIDFWGNADSALKKRLDPALKEAGLPPVEIGSPNKNIIFDLSKNHPEVLDRAKIVGVRHANRNKNFENFVLFNDDNARRNNFYRNWQFATPLGVAGTGVVGTIKENK